MAIEKSTDEKKDEPIQEETVEVTEVTETEEVLVPMSQVKALIDEAKKDFASTNRDADLATAVAKAVMEATHQGTVMKFDELSYLPQREIDKDDWLKTPVHFWALGIFLVIGDDRRRGQAVPAPRGTIRFLPQGSRRKPSGKETEIQIISAYITHSKLEARWLEDHTLCGSRFFLRSDDALSVDIRQAQKIAAYVNGMMSMHANQVIHMAKEMNLEIVDDITIMRISVAQQRAKLDLDKWENAEKEVLKENAKQGMLVKE